MAEMDERTPQINVKIKGSTEIQGDAGSIDTRGGVQILSVMIDLRMDTPDMFVVEYDMMDLEKIALLDKVEEGAEVEIQMGFEQPTTVMMGEVSYIEPAFDSVTGNRISIVGYDKSHRLTRGQTSRTWPPDGGKGNGANVTTSVIANKVINDAAANVGGKKSHGLTPGKVQASPTKYRYVAQYNVNDYQFLKQIGAEASQRQGTSAQTAGEVSFAKPTPAGNAVATLCRERLEGTNPTLVENVRIRLSTAKQYASVEVRSWDPDKKEIIVGKAQKPTLSFGGSAGHEATGKAFYNSASSGRKYVVLDQPVTSKDEADAVAQSVFDQLAMDFLTGEATFNGVPEVRPGAMVELKGYGTRYSGKYLVTAATHTFRPDEGYKTTIAFARNSAN